MKGYEKLNIVKNLIKAFIATEILEEENLPAKDFCFNTEDILRFYNNSLHNSKTLSCFDEVLRLSLTADEYLVIIYQVFNDSEALSEKYADNEHLRWLYDLAIAKLKGDLLEVNWTMASQEAEEHLGKRHITTGLEDHIYKNARAELKRIYEGKNSGYLISPYWQVRRRELFPSNPQFSTC